MVLILSAMVLFMVSAYAVQENNTTSKEKISLLNNTTVNNTYANNTGTNFTAINNTAATVVNQNITAKNNTLINNTAFKENNATATENNTSIEQRNSSMKELGKNESKSNYDIDKVFDDQTTVQRQRLFQHQGSIQCRR